MENRIGYRCPKCEAELSQHPDRDWYYCPRCHLEFPACMMVQFGLHLKTTNSIKRIGIG